MDTKSIKTEKYIVRLKNDPSGISELTALIKKYYTLRNREILIVSSGTSGRGLNEGDSYYVSFMIDRKHILKYSIPTAIRTFACLWIGIGPEYIPINYAINGKYEELFSVDSTTEAVEKNLELLDDYLSGRFDN
ncbi:hypothetical protein [Acidovorax cavernicola]|uniref:hypothetical protein n=1 Tax=Acidovorax cavernicola TaxID=1675792 RepID=UPI0011C37757|nr:hypothetical protein [Acidovorax cavernicola]